MNSHRSAIDRATVVSFDLFDTLLLRRVSRPVDIFRLVQEIFNAETRWYLTAEFAPVRIRAEQILREEAGADDRSVDSVTFDAIHRLVGDMLGLPSDMSRDLAHTELDAERRMLRANPAGVELLDYAIDLDKEVILVSDTYFSSKFIDEVLFELGIVGWKDRYLSCERGRAKSDGSMFAAVAASHVGDRIVHFGDNTDSDVRQAEVFGIRSCWLPKPADTHRLGFGPAAALNGRMVFEHLALDGSRLGNLQRSIINALIGQKCCSPGWPVARSSEQFAIGYGALGPLLMGIVQWLHRSAVAAGCRRILFFARDGAILQRAYNAYWGSAALPSRYVLASRRLVNLPAVADRLTNGDVDFLTQTSVPIPVGEYFDRLDIENLDVDWALRQTGLHRSDLGCEHPDRLRAAMWLLEDQLLAAASSERQRLLTYLEQEDLITSEKTAVVDIGWRGSVQWSWERVLDQAERPCDIEGFYFGLHPAPPARFDDSVMHAYVDGRVDEDVKLHGDLILPSVSLLEFFFTSPDGTAIGIERSDDGTMAARFAKNGLRSSHREVLLDVQAAAIAFVEDFRNAVAGLPSSVSEVERHVATENMVMLVNFPTPRAARILGEIPHGDGYGDKVTWSKIGAPDHLSDQYRFDPELLEQERKRANWKQGFDANLASPPL